MLDMNPEIRARWTAALRSGEFKQGFGSLRTACEGLCCLGVLCELAARAKVIEATRGGNGIWFYDDATNWLPQAVQDWAGLPESNPITSSGNLVFLNDNLGWDFAQIADAIDGGVK